MKKNWQIFWKIFAPVAVAITFLVFLLMGVKRRKQISNGRISYFFRIPFEALRHPLDGFDFLSRKKKRRRMWRILFRLNPWKLGKIIKRKLSVFRSISGIDWKDD